MWCGKIQKRNSKDSMRAAFPENPPKTPVYEALATLNRDFEQVLDDLQRLEALRLFPRRWQRKFLKEWRATLEETRSWANFEVIEMLYQREEREWVRFARIRQRAEKQSAPDDELLRPKPDTGESPRRK
jgi:hypothetical protein